MFRFILALLFIALFPGVALLILVLAALTSFLKSFLRL